ncbi:MAG: replisome organizer region-containing protein [Clostridiaceae bacterium]|nr:replisome organizer region-containing protein [Clostridiaceae bacterium]
MRERKHIKFRTDMPEDTKFKMIDRMPERDVIQYIWFRLVLLAGKVNLMGELYFSKNLPYTIETLAIEFNREEKDVELALNTFMKLEMVEFTEDKVYMVKNFAKHQNIKADKKEEAKKENVTKGKGNGELTKEDNLNVINIKEKEDSKAEHINEEKIDNKDSLNVGNEKVINLEVNNGSNEKINKDKENQTARTKSKEYSPINLENKKNRKSNKNRKKDNVISNFDDTGEEVYGFTDGEPENTLKEGEKVIGTWKF